MLPTIVIKVSSDQVKSPPEKPTKAGTVEYSLPVRFWDEHVRLGLAAGELLKRNLTNTVRVRLNAEAWETLLQSAELCVRNPDVPEGLRVSASRTVRKLMDPRKARPVEVVS